MDGIIHHDDFNDNETNQCSEKYIDIFKTNYSKYVSNECLKICPKDCYSIEYNWDLKTIQIQMQNDFQNSSHINYKNYSISFSLNKNSLAYLYEEKQILSFQAYLCYCGGLFGLLLGTNAKDFIIWLIERIFWLWGWIQIKLIHETII